MFEHIKKRIKPTFLMSIWISSNFLFTISSQAQPALDCNKVKSDDVVITSQGIEPVGKYCDFQEKLPQISTDNKVEYQPPTLSRANFGKPYSAKGNVCRDRGLDTICLTPSNASKLNELK